MARERKRRDGRGGFTLIEVMVATLIVALLAVALIQVAISTKSNSVRMDRELLASQATKALQTALKGYVTGDPTSTANGLCGPDTVNLSPLGACTGNMWCLNNSYQGDAQTSCSGSPFTTHVNSCWALNPCLHTITCGYTTGDSPHCILPYALRQSPYNGTLKYTVAPFSIGQAPQVSINVNWTEP